jgi:ElaB/YqjD/DUF883 family membrane-anchored ribosome-binding protein
MAAGDSSRRDRLASVKDEAADMLDEASAQAEKVEQQASKLQDGLKAGAKDLAADLNAKLKSAGVDTDVMVDAAKGQASELQRLLSAELQQRPLRALGIAAAIGLVVGFMTAR